MSPELSRRSLQRPHSWQSDEHDVRDARFSPQGNERIDGMTGLDDLLSKRKVRADENVNVWNLM